MSGLAQPAVLPRKARRAVIAHRLQCVDELGVAAPLQRLRLANEFAMGVVHRREAEQRGFRGSLSPTELMRLGAPAD